MKTGFCLAVLLLLASAVKSTSLISRPELLTFGQYTFGQHQSVVWHPKGSSLHEILGIANDIRTNPKKYAHIVQKVYIDTIDAEGTVGSTGITSNEGIKAFQEAKAFLESVEPMPAWKLDVGLTAAAYKHSQWMSQSGKLSHTGEGAWTTVRQRFEHFGKLGYGRSKWAENIWTGGRWNPTLALLDLIIDDGVASRGHRKNFFSENTLVGFGLVPPVPGKEDSNWLLTQVLSLSNYESDLSRISHELREQSGINQYLRETGAL